MINFVSKKILVVDDEDDLRINISKLLSIMGFEVDTAENGAVAYELICAKKYDLIISDVKMPVMDGNELLEKVRANEENKFEQFIFLTSNIDLKDIRTGMLLGADDYVTKPFDNKELIQTVKRRLERAGELDEFYKKKFEDMILNLEGLAYYDPVTRLHNQTSLKEELVKLSDRKTPFALFYIEIDGIQEITSFLSTEGYNKLNQMLITSLKSVISPEERIYHMDDSCFCIIFKSSELEAGNELLNSKIDLYKNAAAKPIVSDGIEFLFHSSGGVVICSEFEGKFDPDEILRNARMALSFSKKSGGSLFTVYSTFLRERYNRLSFEFIKKNKSIQKHDEVFDSPMTDNYETKVFFLYPHSIIQTRLVKKIVENEYSAYVLNNHETVKPLLMRYTNSILFINIDSVLPEKDWEMYIRDLKETAELSGVRIGVLTSYSQDDKAEKYLMQIMIECGFIKLKTGFEDSLRVILTVLEANEAKGKRKYVRVTADSKPTTYAEFKMDNQYYRAKIHDISSAAMTISFDVNVYIADTMVFEHIQLLLSGVPVIAKGRIYGSRVIDGKKVYVITFNLEKDEQEKIQNYIFRTRQDYIDKEIADIMNNKS